jgi:Bacterial aa3 type cytochrome c oxidase subunit IV
VPLYAIGWSAFGRQPTRNFRIAPTIGAICRKFGVHLTRAITLNPQRYCAWRDAMDDHGQLEYATARGNDYLGHEQMYRTFVTLTRNSVAVIAVILILMAIFLT